MPIRRGPHPFSVAVVLLACGLCAPRAPRAQGAEIRWIYPLPNSLVTESPATVLGYVLGPPQAELEVRVVSADGSAAPRRQPLYVFKGKIFSGSVALEPGRNNVVVGDAVLPLLYRPGLEGDREGEFRRSRAHGGGIESCNPCHGFARGELTLKDVPPNLCLECHQLGTQALRSVLKANRHTREITRDCLSCHDPHASFEPDLVRDAGGTCGRCHPAQSARSGHDGVAGQPCAACHDAHASAYPALLKGDAEGLCRGCHRAIADPERYPRSYHRPAEQGKCFACHRPHPGEAPSLLRSAIPALCRECHPKRDEGGHAGTLEECRICHEGHLSKNPGLLRATAAVRDACVRCHGDFPGGLSRHPALNEGCAACHNPHKPKGLVEPERVCGRCHKLSDDRFKWPHGQLAMGDVRQCTSCHEPHRSDYPSLLRGKVHYPLQKGGCTACHVQEGKKVALRYEGSKNCMRCHGQITGTSSIVEADKVHQPVYQVDCIACHNPHLGVREDFLLEDPEVLCGWCHGILLRGVENLHGLFREQGTCYTCHVPHISDFRPLLKRPQKELCTKCHPDVLPEDVAEQRKLHGALSEGRCTRCHNPHGTNTERLLEGTRDTLCLGCHPKAARNEWGGAYQYLHGPVGAGNCTACHELRHRHDRDRNDGFLRARGKALCDLCHQVPPEHVPERYRPKMQEVRNDCLACHVPHGAGNPFLMRDRL